MRRAGVLFAVILLVCLSCKKNDDAPQYSGEIVLSSERIKSGLDWVFYGLSFETGKISIYSLSERPDLTSNHIIITDEITSIYLESSNDLDAFYKNGIFATASEAEVYFNNYNEVIASDFQWQAENIKENQIWTVQTANKRFAKIWIKEIAIKSGNTEDYAEVRIQYQYQPDGSRTFDCGCN